ncbi:MAG: hypothetical protein L0229_07670 [Blastocatellia bacterium]|nr:hypothetical protein [Blastocatellia bacterium]
MKSIFRSKSIAGTIAAALFILFGTITPTASAQGNQTIGPITLNVGSRLNSRVEFPFNVTANGQISVRIEWKTTTLLPNDPDIRLRAQIIKPDGSVATTAERTVVKYQFRTVTLNHTTQEASCTSGVWRVRITNRETTNPNRITALARVRITMPSATQNIIGRLNSRVKIRLLEGNTENRTFTLSQRSPGTLRVEVKFNTDLLGGGPLNPRPLRVRLKRPNGSVAVSRQTNSVLNFTYSVTQADINGGNTWTLEFFNPNPQGIENIEVQKLSHTVCQ